MKWFCCLSSQTAQEEEDKGYGIPVEAARCQPIDIGNISPIGSPTSNGNSPVVHSLLNQSQFNPPFCSTKIGEHATPMSASQQKTLMNTPGTNISAPRPGTPHSSKGHQGSRRHQRMTEEERSTLSDSFWRDVGRWKLQAEAQNVSHVSSSFDSQPLTSLQAVEASVKQVHLATISEKEEPPVVKGAPEVRDMVPLDVPAQNVISDAEEVQQKTILPACDLDPKASEAVLKVTNLAPDATPKAPVTIATVEVHSAAPEEVHLTPVKEYVRIHGADKVSYVSPPVKI